MAREIQINVGLRARDSLSLQLTVEGESIVAVELRAVGCLPFLKLVNEWRPKFQGVLGEIALPVGEDHAAVLVREALLKAQGRWAYPYAEEELCHCRAVPTRVVDEAIVGGCHTLEGLRSATSASTSCGTCRPDIEKILAYRLKPTSRPA